MKSKHFVDDRKFMRWWERNGGSVWLLLIMLVMLSQCAYELHRYQ